MGAPYHILDLSGKMVQIGIINGTNTGINITEFPQGLYFLKLTNRSELGGKIVKM
jgi:hypothetical protein